MLTIVRWHGMRYSLLDRGLVRKRLDSDPIGDVHSFVVLPWGQRQEIEDINVMYKFDRRLERLAMVMPLTELFDPGVTHFAHGHLQVRSKDMVQLSPLSTYLPRALPQ